MICFGNLEAWSSVSLNCTVMCPLKGLWTPLWAHFSAHVAVGRTSLPWGCVTEGCGSLEVNEAKTNEFK